MVGERIPKGGKRGGKKEGGEKKPRGPRKGVASVEDVAAAVEAPAAEPAPRPPRAETQFAVALPGYDDMAALLEEVDVVVQQASISQQELETAVAQHDKLQIDKGAVAASRKGREGWLGRLSKKFQSETQRLSEPTAWTSEDLQVFIEKGILTSEHANALQLFNERIDDISENTELLKQRKVQDILVKLRAAREQIVDAVKGRLAEIQERTTGRFARTDTKIEEFYGGRTAKIEGELAELTANPLVAEHLAQREHAAKEAAEAAARAQELAKLKRAADARQRAEKEQRNRLGRAEEALSVVQQCTAEAWERINVVLGVGTKEKVLEAMGKQKRDEREKIIGPLRTQLVNLITRWTIAKEVEIMPWMMKIGDVPFTQANPALRGGEVTGIVRQSTDAALKKRFLEGMNKIDAELAALNFFFDPDRKKMDSPVSKAFHGRGPREAQKHVQGAPGSAGGKQSKGEKKREAQALATDIARVVADGGFEVTLPNGTGEVRGAVLVEERISKKQKPILIISRVAGSIPGVREGMTSDLSGQSFPKWLQIELRAHPYKRLPEPAVSVVVASEPAAPAAEPAPAPAAPAPAEPAA